MREANSISGSSGKHAIAAYIGVDGVTYRELMRPSRIAITRVEGPVDLIGRRELATCYGGANALLAKHGRTAPVGNGYEKVDFEITWPDGATYAGRYDLRGDEVPDLATHVRSFIRWLMENPCDAGESASAQAAAFLNRYDIGQNPIRVTDDEAVTIMMDYRHAKSG